MANLYKFIMSCGMLFINTFQLSFDGWKTENADLLVQALASSKQWVPPEKLDLHENVTQCDFYSLTL